MEPTTAPDILTETAQSKFGINYLFPFQRLVISNILEAGGCFNNDDESDPLSKQIVILPTGAGKSLCFMLPAVMLENPTLVIFPLLSLISDQKRRCDDAGIGAASLTGGQSDAERNDVFSGIACGNIKIVLTNPETALSEKVLPRLKNCSFAHLVFDEVHTVSEWGDSFRPAYLESRRIYKEAEIPIVTAFTATASDTVLKRVKEILFPGDSPHLISANPDRPNIAYTVLPSLCKIRSLEKLLNSRSPGAVRRPALVFCSTRKKASGTALGLRMRLKESEIFFYHAGLNKEEKKKIEEWFFTSDNGVLCATTAYGMGIDKSNIRTVIHNDLSPSIEAYLQESGRAGRDRTQAEAILLYSPSDRRSFRGADNPAASARFNALLSFAENSSTCRRESLMHLLGAEPDTCFGCDVCRKTVTTEPELKAEIVSLLRRNKRRFSRSDMTEILLKPPFSLLRNDAQTLITELTASECIREIKHWPWKGCLTSSIKQLGLLNCILGNF
jgi:ATP-dependent DNA helicase RecQ